jgi:hypothetical protein
VEVLNLKNTLTQINNSMERFSSSSDIAKEIIGKIEYRSGENIQNKCFLYPAGQ